MTYYHTSVRLAKLNCLTIPGIGKNVKQWQLIHYWWRVNWYKHFRKTVFSVVDWKKCPPKDVHGSIPGICEYYMWQKKIFADFIKVNILRWDYPALFGRALNAVTCILIRGRKREISHGRKRRKCDHRNRDWSDVATNPGMLAATRSRKRQETNSFREPPKGVWVRHLTFGPMKLILDFWPPGLWEDTFLLCQATKLWWFVTAALGD